MSNKPGETFQVVLVAGALGALLVWAAFNNAANKLGADPGVLFQSVLSGLAFLIVLVIGALYVHARWLTTLAAGLSGMWLLTALPVMRNIADNAAAQFHSRWEPAPGLPWWDTWWFYGPVTLALLGALWWAWNRSDY